MEWGLLLVMAPHIIIAICLFKWLISGILSKPKHKLKLIKGGRYDEDKRGPYGKSR